MIVAKTGQWKKAARILGSMPGRFPNAVRRAQLQVAHWLRGKMVKNLTSQTGLDKHSDITLALRRLQGFGGTKILIRSGAMRNSINVTPVFGGGVFVGIKRSAPGKGGEGPYNLAIIHEEERSWVMTERQRRWLFANLAEAGFDFDEGGGGGGKITIPARPFITPVIEDLLPSELRDKFAQFLAGNLEGDLGSPGTGVGGAFERKRDVKGRFMKA